LSLRPYQVEGVSFLGERENALLADEMGLGKTVEAIKAIEILLRRPGCDRALVVAPASLQLNWEREFALWAPSVAVRRLQGSGRERQLGYLLPVPVLIASYEQIRADATVIPRDKVRFAVVLLDEAQRIRNRNSQTAVACKIMPRDRSWALTGTPLENRPDDLVSLFAFIYPGLLRPGMPLGAIHQRMQDHFLRRTKSEVLKDLPEIVLQDMPLELTAAQRGAYDREWSNAVEDGHSSTSDLLALMTRLKLICNRESDSGESVKLDTLRLILESQSGDRDKLLVFSQYVQSIEWLRSQVAPYPCSVLHGGMSQLERDQVIQRFEKEPGPHALFISLMAGGVGLNLNAARTVVLFDRWWNPAVEDQAIHRAHRFGRKEPLQVIRFIVVNSIEENIQAILNEKRAIFEQYVEDAPGADVGPLPHRELRRLLGLPPEKYDSAADVKDHHGGVEDA
jgi:SNF2 family DNA or RNA helicase